MYYFDIKENTFLHSSVHDEVSDETKIDTTRYIFVVDDYFNECVDKRASRHELYMKDGELKISKNARQNNYQTFDIKTEDFILTDEAKEQQEKDKQQQQQAIVQNEIKSATTMINTLQDELDLELSENIETTQEKLKQWKKYRVLCLKFVNDEQSELPTKPE